MQMRKSRVLRKLRAGEIAISYKTNLRDPRAAEIAARAGFDCVWTCLEHVPNDLPAVEQQVWATKAYDVDLLTRVPGGHTATIFGRWRRTRPASWCLT